MGYSIFITRKDHWYDHGGPRISREEWLSLVDSDPELSWAPELGEHFAVWNDTSSRGDRSWITWDGDNLESTRPDQPMIEKMLALAEQLGARVVGEESEVYVRGGAVLRAPPPTIIERVRALWLGLRASFSKPEAPSPGFGVGARVRDFRGRVGTVTRIDLRAEHGLGVIEIRYDDGRSESCAAVAHGLERADAPAGSA
jgi:hypothetical protein